MARRPLPVLLIGRMNAYGGEGPDAKHPPSEYKIELLHHHARMLNSGNAPAGHVVGATTFPVRAAEAVDFATACFKPAVRHEELRIKASFQVTWRHGVTINAMRAGQSYDFFVGRPQAIIEHILAADKEAKPIVVAHGVAARHVPQVLRQGIRPTALDPSSPGYATMSLLPGGPMPVVYSKGVLSCAMGYP